MLEYLVIFGKGGAILWTFGQLFNTKGSPIDALIQQCLLEDRGGENSFLYKPPSGTHYTLKWTFHNGLDLVFVAAYQHMLSLPFMEALLDALKAEFATVYQPGVLEYPGFDDTYKRVRERVEKRALAAKMKTQPRPNAAAGTPQGHGDSSSRAKAGGIQEQTNGSDSDGASKGSTDAGAGRQPAVGGGEPDRPAGASSEDEDAAFNRQAIMKKFRAGKGAKKGSSKGPTKGKKPRTWGQSGSESDLTNLDFSARSEGTSTDGAAAAREFDPTAAAAAKSRMDVVEEVSYDEDDEALEAALQGGAAQTGQPRGVLAGFLSTLQTSVVGKAALTAEDTAAAVDAMRRRLQQRNVSSEVAARLCASVASQLEGRRLASFTGVSALVRGAFESAITRILSPKRSVDVLAEVRASQAKRKPYSIVFVGVNGVGKSTNLAKIAYWLRQQGLRVMIAACDTFRSGAVEQLRTHCNRLGVTLYDRGYDKDPTNVAAEALRQAGRDGIDVVLIDTAGRMQDNEPLMHALSMLINKNNPDLVLFVGEALVGNDGVNQLVKFNQRLADLSPPGREPRLIDGIVVTKFDAIDDKVGAVLSMAYSSGAPIMFVGCGQTYVDLKRLNVKDVVRALLK